MYNINTIFYMSLINNFNNRKVFFGFSIGLLETLIIIISNIIFIPAYIKHWNVEEYYSWLLFLTATFFLNIIYLGFNDFIFHENLKNKNNKKYILENSSYLLLIIFTINCLLLFVGFVELNFNLFAKLLNISQNYTETWSFYFFLYILYLFLIGSYNGLFHGPLAINNKYNLIILFNLFKSISIHFIPGLLVLIYHTPFKNLFVFLFFFIFLINIFFFFIFFFNFYFYFFFFLFFIF